MELKDLFKPKWKHSNLAKSLAAVQKINNYKKLAKIVKKSKDKKIRTTALDKILLKEDGNDLVFLYQIGLMYAKGTGQSIVQIHASIKNLTDHQIDVLIKPGTYFISHGDYQNMVTRCEYSISFDPFEENEIWIDATCINAGRPIPSEHDSFKGVARVSDDLMRFLGKAGQDHIGPMATQAGTWAITDSMSKDEIQTRLYNTDRYTGQKTAAISGADIDKAMIVLWKLGINTELWNETTLRGKNAKDFKIDGHEELTSTVTILKPSGTVTDIDGNVYQTVKIGGQEWTIENLRTTKYNDGTPIPLAEGDSAWSDADAKNGPAHCYYENSTDPTHIKKYGALYNWHVVNTGKLAPPGWHVPTDDEWTKLEEYLIANGYNWDGTTWGNKIAKSLASKTVWDSSIDEGDIGNNPSKNNASGFSALPGGCRGSYGGFVRIGHYGNWWSATEYDASYAWNRNLYYVHDYLNRDYSIKGAGVAVRLLRD